MKTILIIAIAVFPFFSTQATAQNDACKIIGELTLPVLESGGLLSCMSSGNPLVCKVAMAVHTCAQDPSCNGVVATVVENGCVFTVTKTGNAIKIVGTAAEAQVYEMKRVYDSLNTVEGMHWLMRRLAQ